MLSWLLLYIYISSSSLISKRLKCSSISLQESLTSFELSYQSSFRLVFELESGDIMGKGKLLCLSRSFTFFGVERSTLWKLLKCLGEGDNQRLFCDLGNDQDLRMHVRLLSWFFHFWIHKLMTFGKLKVSDLFFPFPTIYTHCSNCNI